MKVYSTDEETFNHDSVGDVLDELDSAGELAAGRVYWSADAEKPTPASLFDIDSLMDGLRDRAYDIGGEFAEDFPDITNEKVSELDAIIKNWLDANVAVSFYRCRNVQEHTVTLDDVAEFKQSATPRQQEW